jgi:PAS domain S-box-containing protein
MTMPLRAGVTSGPDKVAPDLRPQIEHAAVTIAAGLNADICHIYKLCSSQNQLQLVAGTGCPTSASHQLALDLSRPSLEAQVLTAGTPLIAEDFAHDPLFHGTSLNDRHQAASGLAVVIQGESAPFGVCSVYSRRLRSFSPSDIELVEEVARALTELFRSARLVRDRARFEAVTRSVDEAVVELTLDGRIFGWNAAAEALYGYPHAEVSGQSIARFLSTGGALEHEALLDTASAGGTVGPIETVFRRSDRTSVDVELRVVPIVVSGTRVVAVSMIARDLTPQRKADSEKRELLDRLQHSQRMEVLGRLAGGMAHDFNNLLTVITGCTEFIQSRVVDATVLDDLRQIDHASRSAVQLARHLLAFGRRYEPRFTDLDLTAVVNSARGMLRRLVGPGIQVIVLDGERPVTVRADVIQIERILINLAVNARDAMPEGGRIFIDASHATIRDEFAKDHPGYRPGSYGRLQVSDSGVGMDSATLSRIFEPFFTTKDSESGTGLGLATVRDIVDQSGGFLTVQSEPGEGATFNIYIPSAKLEVAA